MVERVKSSKRGGGNYFASPKQDLQFISSGSKLLDLALGGGWAEDRIFNIVGDKSTGKTLLMIEASANFIRKYPKGRIFYREAESAFDPKYAQALGMPLQSVDMGVSLETIEDMFEDLFDIAKGKPKHPSLYLVDSLDALSDRAEMERDMDAGTYGAEKAKKLSQLFRRLVSQIAAARVTVGIVSQVRSKIGVSFGPTTTRSGGRALDFYASQVINLSQLGTVKRTISGIDRTTGIDIRAKVTKNKVGLPFREAQFEIAFGYGVDDLLACLQWLDEAGVKDFNWKKYLTGKAKGPQSQLKEAAREITKLPDSDYWAEFDEIKKVVEEHWYRIESSFMPKRQKYGERQ